MKKALLRLMAPLLVLGLAACTEAVREGKPYDQLPLLTQEAGWAFFKALPSDALPGRVATLEQREDYQKRYFEYVEQEGMDIDYYANYEDDGPAPYSSVVYSEAFLSEEDAFASEHGDEPTEYATLLLYPGVDADRIFGILQRGSFTGEGSTTLPEKYFWYSIARNKVTPVAALPLDRPYSEDDLTADPLVTFGAEGLYYAMKEKDFEPIYLPKSMQVYINGVGSTDVVYNWDGVRFVRDESFKAPIIYNFGFGNISLGGDVPWNVKGYETRYADTESGPRYDLVPQGAEQPVLSLFANPNDNMKVWAIYVYSDRYTNYHDIHPGMKANEAIRILNEANETWYGNDSPPSVSPEYRDGDGKEYAAIFSGFNDNFIYLVEKNQYAGNNRFSPEARIVAIAIINGQG